MVQLRDNYWAVEVPDDARNIGIAKGRMLSYQAVGAEVIGLPPGTWQIICTIKDATYTQAAEIVESNGDGFKDYNEDNFHHDLPFMSPFDSLRSLLTVKGCDLSKNWLILENDK